MNIKDKIIQIVQTYESISVKENFSNFSISINANSKPIVNNELIHDIINLIDSNDKFSLSIRLDDGDAIILDNRECQNEFNIKLQNEIQYYEKDELVTLNFEVFKSDSNDLISIYSYSDFINFFKNLNLYEQLNVLNIYFGKRTRINLRTIEQSIKPFSTAFFTINIDEKKDFEKFNDIPLNENCHFGDSNTYRLNPHYFNPIITSNNDFVEIFNGLCCLFSIIYIFDISSLKDGKLYYKINGFKAIQGELEIDENLHKGKEIFYNIFLWCYSSEGNTTDKLGLTRNIISIHYKNNIIELENSVLESIQSAYKTYLKENVSKYIELRGKIHDELSWIGQKSGEIIDNYISSYQKSIYSFLSFFISVFVLRFISVGGSIRVFNRDATILSLAFLLLSVVFLIFSSMNLLTERERLEKKYINIKNRFKDLLLEKDINNILNDDREFNYEKKYIKKRYNNYKWLWVITIIILAVAVIIVSDYISVELAKDVFSNWKKIVK